MIGSEEGRSWHVCKICIWQCADYAAVSREWRHNSKGWRDFRKGVAAFEKLDIKPSIKYNFPVQHNFSHTSTSYFCSSIFVNIDWHYFITQRQERKQLLLSSVCSQQLPSRSSEVRREAFDQVIRRSWSRKGVALGEVVESEREAESPTGWLCSPKGVPQIELRAVFAKINWRSLTFCIFYFYINADVWEQLQLNASCFPLCLQV